MIAMVDISLDPRTNDPIIDDAGNLVILDDPIDEAVQALRVWFSTGPYTDILRADFGFDLMSVIHAPYGETLGYDKAIAVQLHKCVEDLRPYLERIALTRYRIEGRNLIVELTFTTRDKLTDKISVTIG